MIALLGATGNIGASLGRLFSQQGEVALFARDATRLAALNFSPNAALRTLDTFDAAEFDLVINAIGAGGPKRVGQLGDAILDVTRLWDDAVLSRLRPGARYVFLSSGAVHSPPPVPAYTVSKLEAEARHRAMPERAILDLRVFAYADTNLPIDAGFFLSELASSIIKRQPFCTTRADMVRDYAGAQELKALIDAWIASGALNDALDLYTAQPAGKLEILKAAIDRYGVAIDWVDAVQSTPTGDKPTYASKNRAAAAIGYRPARTAMDVVLASLDTVTGDA